MSEQALSLHRLDENWLLTPKREARGYIDAKGLKELWFHTGTNCNLFCPFCLEGSKPGDDRLQMVTLEDIQPWVKEALELGVERFSFTGGEPFINKEMVDILDYALTYRPCLVLTNATKPLHLKLDAIKKLKDQAHPLSFRVSFDHPDPNKHDEGRGAGNFKRALDGLKELHDMGFQVSIARQMEPDEDAEAIDRAYYKTLAEVGLDESTGIVRFPDFLTPGMQAEVPHITEHCMTEYHSEETRSAFMCSFSRMVVKKHGEMKAYACTLVDDDEDYDLGYTLSESMQTRVMLRHHRCFSCFKYGASCSEA